MTPDALAAHVAALPRLPCGCTENHEHLCPVARALWGRIAGVRDDKGKLTRQGLWSKYSGDPAGYRDVYFAATRKFLAHFEDGREQQEPVRQGMLL